MRLLYAFITLALCLVASADITWKNCGTAADLLNLRELTWTPSVPQRGQPLNVTVSGTLNGVVDQGSKVLLFVKWGFVRVPVPPQDVCKDLSRVPDEKYHCPLQPGDMTVTQSFMLPEQIPEVRISSVMW